MPVRIGLWLALTVALATGCACVPPAAPPGNRAANAQRSGNANADSNANEAEVIEEAPAGSAKLDVAGDAGAPSTDSPLDSGLHALVFAPPGAERPVNYLLFLPENYKAGRRWPLLFYLHGRSVSGDDPKELTKYGPPRVVGRDEAFSFIVVAPQCRAGERWTDVEMLDALLGEVLGRYPVDPDRVYLTGYSMGAGGAWRFGGARPERFAAVAALAGVEEPGAVRGLARVPAWAFHGTDDEVVPASASQKMVDALRAAGGDAKLELLPGCGHDITDVYDRRDLYTWFLEHERRQ